MAVQQNFSLRGSREQLCKVVFPLGRVNFPCQKLKGGLIPYTRQTTSLHIILVQIQLTGGRFCLRTCSYVITGPAAEWLRCFTLILITPEEAKRVRSTCVHTRLWQQVKHLSPL